MCDSLSRRLSAEDFLLLGSVSGNGVRAVDLPRQSARYRSLPAFDAGQALPHGIPRQGGALYPGRRQRVARLANLCRLCPGVDRRCATVVCPRSHRGGSGAESVRVGLDHHRSLPDFVSLGPVSSTQGRGEDAYAAGPAWQYPHVHPHHRRQSARRQHPRRTPSRSGRVLRDGSWLHRFPTPLLLHSVLRFLCRTYQTECLTSTALFAYGGQEYRRTFRSHRHPNRHGVCQSVSGCLAASELLRRRDQQASEVSDQQLHASSTYDRPDLPVPLAGGTLFSLDQAAPPDQILFRYQRECGEDPDMDCGLGLCAGGDCAEAFGTAGESLPNSTDSQRHAFRESAHFTGSRSIRLPERLIRRPQPVDSVQLLAGHSWLYPFGAQLLHYLQIVSLPDSRRSCWRRKYAIVSGSLTCGIRFRYPVTYPYSSPTAPMTYGLVATRRPHLPSM